MSNDVEQPSLVVNSPTFTGTLVRAKVWVHLKLDAEISIYYDHRTYGLDLTKIPESVNHLSPSDLLILNTITAAYYSAQAHRTGYTDGVLVNVDDVLKGKEYLLALFSPK